MDNKYTRVWIGEGKRVHLWATEQTFTLCGNWPWGRIDYGAPGDTPLCKACERVAKKEEVADATR